MKRTTKPRRTVLQAVMAAAAALVAGCATSCAAEPRGGGGRRLGWPGRRARGKAAPVASGAVALPAGLCRTSASDDKAIMIYVGASVLPDEAPKMSFQVDAEANTAFSQGATEWGRPMWKDMLG